MKLVKGVVAVFLLVIFSSSAFAVVMAGGEKEYRVAKGDSLMLISSRFGVNRAAIRRENDLDEERLMPGQKLRLDTVKIPPKTVDNGIIVDVPGRMLYYFKAGKLVMSFPVGLGMPQWNGITQWRTPTGNFTITGKEENPVWYVPESIQWQMQAEGKPVLTRMPPGPDNPLGRFVLYTSVRGIVIHETISPTTVYRFESHGCVRVLPQNMKPFYDKVGVGTHGQLLYDPVKVAVTDEGKVFLEVDPDIYGKVQNVMDEVIDRIDDLHATAEVDWPEVRKVVHEQAGIADNVTS